MVSGSTSMMRGRVMVTTPQYRKKHPYIWSFSTSTGNILSEATINRQVTALDTP